MLLEGDEPNERTDNEVHAVPAVPVIMARPVAIAPPEPVPEPPSFGRGITGRRAIVELALMFVVFFAAQIAFGIMIAVSGQPYLHRYVNIVGAVGLGCILVATTVWLHHARRLPLWTLGWQSKSLSIDVLLGVVMTIAVLALFAALTGLAAAFAPSLYEQMTKAQESIEEAFPRMHPGWIVLLTTWVAFYEEFVFRGFLLTRLRALIPSWTVTVPAGAMLFALPHAYEGPVGVVLIFVLGTILGSLYVWRQSLVPVITLHFCFNTVQLLVLYVASDTWK